jgi:hypothetical protein
MREPKPKTRGARPVTGRTEAARTQSARPQLEEILRRPATPAAALDRLGDLEADLGRGAGGRRPGRKFEAPEDFEGPEIKPAAVLKLAKEIEKLDTLPARGALDSLSATILAGLARGAPEALPLKPLPAGAKGARLPLPDRVLTPLLRQAAIEMSGGAARVLWDDGVSQLIVSVGEIAAELRDGRITVTIPVTCDQAKTRMKVPFATGGRGRNAGMVLATADRPLGDALIARIWGEALIALAHGALLSVVTSLAGASGRDERNDTLVPRALQAEDGLLRVETGARSRFRKALE